jgi:hypothetical protein
MEEVPEKEAREYAKSIDAYFRLVSAKDGTGIPDFIHDLLEIVFNYKDKLISSFEINSNYKKKKKNGKCF